MPYIVVKSDREELERRELGDSIVIGRAPDCDLTIRDILLSRRHCRLDQTPQGWTITDLNSKNGSSINGEKLTGTRPLKDSDVVRMGRCKIVFYSGILDEDEDSIVERLMTPARPVDPNDSLSGTLTGFQMLMPGETENPDNLPVPHPKPKDPDAYQRAEVQDLLSAIASSSWDSIYAGARQANAGGSMADETEETPRKRRARPRSPIDFSLQASPAPVAAPAAVVEPAAKEESAETPPPDQHIDQPFVEKPGETEKRFWNSQRKRLLKIILASGCAAAIAYFGIIPYIAKGPPPPQALTTVIDVPAPGRPVPNPAPTIVSVVSTEDLNLPIALPTVAELNNSQLDLGYSDGGVPIADLK